MFNHVQSIRSCHVCVCQSRTPIVPNNPGKTRWHIKPTSAKSMTLSSSYQLLSSHTEFSAIDGQIIRFFWRLHAWVWTTSGTKSENQHDEDTTPTTPAIRKIVAFETPDKTHKIYPHLVKHLLWNSMKHLSTFFFCYLEFVDCEVCSEKCERM